MNRIEELIEKYCPDGVEFKHLWKLTAWDKKFNAVEKNKQNKVINYHYFLASDLKSLVRENGKIKILTTNVSNIYTDEDLVDGFISEGEVVYIPWGGNPIVQYYNGKFVTADNRIATSLDTKVLDNKYLYYVLINKLKEIATFYRGSGIKHPDMSKVLNLKIPVPPLEVQKEIVRILDTFIDLTSELTSELIARKQQYIFYKDKLLTFPEKGQNIVWKTLREIVNFRNGIGHENEIVSNGKFIVVNSKFISTNGLIKKYSNHQLSPLYTNDILMVMSDLPKGKALAKCFLVDGNNKYTLNQRICALTNIDKKNVDVKFLFYILNRNNQLLRYDNGVDQTNLKKDNILEIKIPIPELTVQKRIVRILDNFDKICSDLNEGLPAEIEARQKQYEYFRNKLLSFKEKKV